MFHSAFIHNVTEIRIEKSVMYSEGVPSPVVKIVLTHEYQGVTTETDLHLFGNADDILPLFINNMEVPDEESGSEK